MKRLERTREPIGKALPCRRGNGSRRHNFGIVALAPVLWLVFGIGPWMLTDAAGDEPSAAVGAARLHIHQTDFLRLVAEENEAVKRQHLEALISEQGVERAASVFEPSLTLDWEVEHSVEQNDSALAYQRSALSQYAYTDRTYSASVGGLIPIGTRYELFYDLYDPANSLQRADEYGRENTVKTGVRITQPLLKNFGTQVNRAERLVSEKEHAIDQARLLRIRMTTVHEAAAAYAGLQLAQRRLELEKRLLALARQGVELVARTAAEGRAPRSAVFQAESDLARREARISFAAQRFRRSSSMVRQMLVATTGQTLQTVYAADPVEALERTGIEAQPDMAAVIERRPEHLVARLRSELEDVRLAYAKNQKLPEFNLKMSAGRSGLDRNWAEAHHGLDDDYGFWSLGAEVIVPLMGGKKGRSDLEAARIRKQQVELALEHLQSLIADEVLAARAEEAHAFDEAQRMGRVADRLKRVVDDGEKRRQEGRIGRYETIEQRIDWLQARLDLLEKTVQHRKILLAVWLAEGRILERFGLNSSP